MIQASAAAITSCVIISRHVCGRGCIPHQWQPNAAAITSCGERTCSAYTAQPLEKKGCSDDILRRAQLQRLHCAAMHRYGDHILWHAFHQHLSRRPFAKTQEPRTRPSFEQSGPRENTNVYVCAFGLQHTHRQSWENENIWKNSTIGTPQHAHSKSRPPATHPKNRKKS